MREHCLSPGYHLGSKKPLAPSFIYGTASVLPFKDHSFDLVVSSAAFEHFLDVPAVLSEAHRVLRPNGVLWISIHLFTALSGGHNVGLRLGALGALPAGIDAWDHLREQKIPFSVPLNRWRKSQYVEEVARRFEIVSERLFGEEGTALLSEELRNELIGYSIEELTSPALILCARKR